MAADPYKQKNKDEPGTKEKIEDLSAFIKSSKFGMMTTKEPNSDLLVSRAMAVAAQESAGLTLLFHTNTQSGKTHDLSADPHVNISFLSPSGDWASVSGLASIVDDRATVAKYYSPALKAWLGDLGDGKHDGSENDPRIGVIKVEARTVTYSLSKGTMVGRAIEVVKGAVTGEVASVAELREIGEEEIKSYRASL
jgi:general stress protein 26